MTYQPGACDHEAHVTREELEHWWARIGGSPVHAHPEPATGVRASQAIAVQIEDECDADD